MIEPDPQQSFFDHTRVVKNIQSLIKRLEKIIEHKEESNFSDIDLEISGLMHQMSYFSILIQLFYPLETTYDRIRTNLTNPNDDKTVKAQVISIDLNCRKSFLVLNCFSLETLLRIIIEKHDIRSDSRNGIVNDYLNVLDYFEIGRNEYENLLKIFHYTRNSLHSGTKIKKEWGPFSYKGKDFSAKIGKQVEHASWDYFTYFTHEMVEIFEKIYKSSKFNNQ